jgi:anti-sigma regulatory factor (Ser/Thr protein kinase)
MSLQFAQPLFSAEKPRQEAGSPLFFTLSQQQPLEQVLQQPYRVFIENGRFSAVDIALSRIVEQKPDFALCLGTRSCQQHNTAIIAAQSLEHRNLLPDGKWVDVATCLQEVVQNAVIHGNLEINHHFDNIETMDAYCSLVNRKLTMEPYANRRISICAWYSRNCLTLSVTDQGPGFSLPSAEEEPKAFSGRGLMIVRSLASRLWMDSDPRTLLMAFEG